MSISSSSSSSSGSERSRSRSVSQGSDRSPLESSSVDTFPQTWQFYQLRLQMPQFMGSAFSFVRPWDWQEAPGYSSFKPVNHAMPNTFSQYIIRTAFTMGDLGYKVGLGYGFWQAGLDVEFAETGGVLQAAAWGNIGFLSIAAGYGIVRGIRYCIEQRRDSEQYNRIDDDMPQLKYETTRYWWMPSLSNFYPADVRMFLASEGIGAFTSALLTQQNPLVGGLAGQGLGAALGLLAILHQPWAMNKIIGWLGSWSSRLIQTKHAYQESRHDVPWYARLAFAGWAARALVSLMLDPSSKAFAVQQTALIGTISAMVLLSPHFFALSRRIFLECQYDPKDPEFKEPAWHRATQMDIPWYVKLAAGAVTSAVLKEVATLFLGQPVGGDGFWVAAAILPLFSSALVALWQNIRACCATGTRTERQYINTASRRPLTDTPTPPQWALDMPFYAQAVMGVLGGAVIGSAVQYVAAPQEEPFIWPLVSAVAGAALSVASPFVQGALGRYVSAPLQRWFGISASRPLSANLNLPFNFRVLFGAWSGALFMTSFGNVYPNLGTDSMTVTPGYIGPALLGISNAPWAPHAAIIGAVVGLLLPMVAHVVQTSLESCRDLNMGESLCGCLHNFFYDSSATYGRSNVEGFAEGGTTNSSYVETSNAYLSNF